jgi:hypothetical protein
MYGGTLKKHFVFLWIVHPSGSRNDLESTNNADKYNDFNLSITTLNKL